MFERSPGVTSHKCPLGVRPVTAHSCMHAMNKQYMRASFLGTTLMQATMRPGEAARASGSSCLPLRLQGVCIARARAVCVPLPAWEPGSSEPCVLRGRRRGSARDAKRTRPAAGSMRREDADVSKSGAVESGAQPRRAWSAVRADCPVVAGVVGGLRERLGCVWLAN